MMAAQTTLDGLSRLTLRALTGTSKTAQLKCTQSSPSLVRFFKPDPQSFGRESRRYLSSTSGRPTASSSRHALRCSFQAHTCLDKHSSSRIDASSKTAHGKTASYSTVPANRRLLIRQLNTKSSDDSVHFTAASSGTTSSQSSRTAVKSEKGPVEEGGEPDDEKSKVVPKGGVPRVTMYTGGPECGLCEIMKQDLAVVQILHPFELELFNIHDPPEWADPEEAANIQKAYLFEIPVLHMNGEYVGRHRLNQTTFIKQLEALRNGDPYFYLAHLTPSEKTIRRRGGDPLKFQLEGEDFQQKIALRQQKRLEKVRDGKRPWDEPFSQYVLPPDLKKGREKYIANKLQQTGIGASAPLIPESDNKEDTPPEEDGLAEPSKDTDRRRRGRSRTKRMMRTSLFWEPPKKSATALEMERMHRERKEERKQKNRESKQTRATSSHREQDRRD